MNNRQSMRLQRYDYSKSGFYFVTICTYHKQDFFGEVVNGKMILNKYGKVIENNWLEIRNHFKDTTLHEFVIMPDHIHGIIEIVKEEKIKIKNQVNKFQKIIPRSIGSIIRGFKIGGTKWFRENTDINILWQRNFHESIIRSKKEYHIISRYIKNNPKNFNPQGALYND